MPIATIPEVVSIALRDVSQRFHKPEGARKPGIKFLILLEHISGF